MAVTNILRELARRGRTWHEAAWSRDVPRSCSCPWRWTEGLAAEAAGEPSGGRYVRTGTDPECVWHKARAARRERRPRAALPLPPPRLGPRGRP